jgi:hypothetical protein
MPAIAERLLDLCDPDQLTSLRIRPDDLALPPTRRTETQAIALRVWDEGAAGFRWWSALHGAWHSTVVFIGIDQAE